MHRISVSASLRWSLLFSLVAIAGAIAPRAALAQTLEPAASPSTTNTNPNAALPMPWLPIVLLGGLPLGLRLVKDPEAETATATAPINTTDTTAKPRPPERPTASQPMAAKPVNASSPTPIAEPTPASATPVPQTAAPATPTANAQPVAPSLISTGATPTPDRPETAQEDVEAAKFDVGQTDEGPTSLADVDAGLADLPAGYGESRIVLLPRDPQYAYAYWDLPGEHKAAVRQAGGQRLALRLFDVTNIDVAHQSPHSMQQYDCDEMAREWYLPIPVSDRDYLVEIGYLTAEAQWLLLARSSPIRIPPVFPSDWYDDQFLTINWDEDLRGKTVAQLTPPSARPTAATPHDQLFNLAQPAAGLRVAGSIFGSMQHVPASVPPGSAQLVGGMSSFVFPSGMGLWSLPTPSGMGLSGVGFSASAPPIRSRKFWLIADAELIVYGATEPDATVTIAGRPVQLNPDGTFRFHMSFPDGRIDFPILAVAADGEQNRAIHMTFDRQTPVWRANTRDDAIDETY